MISEATSNNNYYAWELAIIVYYLDSFQAMIVWVLLYCLPRNCQASRQLANKPLCANSALYVPVLHTGGAWHNFFTLTLNMHRGNHYETILKQSKSRGSKIYFRKLKLVFPCFLKNCIMCCVLILSSSFFYIYNLFAWFGCFLLANS